MIGLPLKYPAKTERRFLTDTHGSPTSEQVTKLAEEYSITVTGKNEAVNAMSFPVRLRSLYMEPVCMCVFLRTGTQFSQQYCTSKHWNSFHRTVFH